MKEKEEEEEEDRDTEEIVFALCTIDSYHALTADLICIIMLIEYIYTQFETIFHLNAENINPFL